MAIKSRQALQEGEFTNSFFKNRFSKNKNIILAITGSTGSGKSYISMKIAEHHYLKTFNEPFPIENVCFSNGEAMKRLSSGKLRKGELLIFEEAGVNMGALDFQSKMSKMMNYTMQSFRSMNVGLILNLPVLTMLQKSSRLLLHAHFVTVSIDHNKKLAKIKPFLHQLAQSSGKSYMKYPKIVQGGRSVKLHRLNYGLPSNDLLEQYEAKKVRFLSELTQQFSDEYDKIEADKVKKDARKDLTEKQMEIFNLLNTGKNTKEIAELQGKAYQSIYQSVILIRKKGYLVKK